MDWWVWLVVVVLALGAVVAILWWWTGRKPLSGGSSDHPHHWDETFQAGFPGPVDRHTDLQKPRE